MSASQSLTAKTRRADAPYLVKHITTLIAFGDNAAPNF
ncbi:hypothetical protein PLIP_a2181 [Pseudoalteromonas lipolytica LMEB 39]|nr:hypothetical protein [Pseudoalteromonas lipolytica LMEB 39]